MKRGCVRTFTKWLKGEPFCEGSNTLKGSATSPGISSPTSSSAPLSSRHTGSMALGTGNASISPRARGADLHRREYRQESGRAATTGERYTPVRMFCGRICPKIQARKHDQKGGRGFPLFPPRCHRRVARRLPGLLASHMSRKTGSTRASMFAILSEAASSGQHVV